MWVSTVVWYFSCFVLGYTYKMCYGAHVCLVEDCFLFSVILMLENIVLMHHIGWFHPSTYTLILTNVTETQ